MQEDFHYYATYCAALLAGCSHEESLEIGYASQFVDCCTETLLKKVGGPKAAASTQLQSELMNTTTDLLGLQKITRIWSSFHFLPYDLNAAFPKRRPKRYLNKYRLLCKPNGVLVTETVHLAKGRPLPAVGLAMHVLADTWAHSYFAGTPSLVINNTNRYFYELIGTEKRPVVFTHNATAPDDLGRSRYVNTLYQNSENTVMNLGHGRAGHLPDYSFARYEYLPAWGGYVTIVKDNPSDYWHAFCQMVYALRFLRGERENFVTECYEEETLESWKDEILSILQKRQPNACADWKQFGESLSGQCIEDFDIGKYQPQYRNADKAEKDGTFLGQFFLAAMAQKSMVTHSIFSSGNLLAGLSVNYRERGFRGIRDYRKLLTWYEGGEKH